MENISLFTVFTVTVPEVILDIFMVFLLVGEKSRLKLNEKYTLLRFTASVALMALLTIPIRIIAPVPIAALGMIVVTFSLVMCLVMDIKYSKALLGMLFVAVFLVSVENLYIGPGVAFVDKEFVLYSNDFKRLLYSLPERIVQLIIIPILWSRNIILMNFEKYRKIQRECTFFIMSFLAAEATLFWSFMQNILTMGLYTKVGWTLGFIFFLIANVYLVKMISRVTTTVRLELERSQEANKEFINAIKIVEYFVNKKDLSKASQIIKKQLDKDQEAG